jgi:multiple sugar transport system permease protein
MRSNFYSRSKRKKFYLYTILSIISILFLYPLFITVSNSLRNVYSLPTVFLPEKLDFSSYFLATTLIPFWQYSINSLKIVSISLFFGVVMNFLFGYAFARLKARGKDLIFTIMISQMMIPAIAISIPQYILFSNYGIKDTYWIWVLSGIGGNAFVTFLFRQFFANIPRQLEEAAKIDGCSIIGIIWKIFVPLSGPILAVAFFFVFNATWGDYMDAYMYLSESKYPLSMALFGATYNLPGRPAIKLDTIYSAASVLLIIPVVIVFYAVQKQLIAGITTTGIKG